MSLFLFAPVHVMGGIGAAVRSIRPVDLPGKVLVVGDLAVCQLPLAQKPFPQKISHKLPVKVHPHRWVDRPVFPVLIPGDRFALCFSVPGAPLQLEQVDIAWKILLQPEQTIDEGIVIDTLQKVREMAGERYSYASDYEVIGQLKTFADFHNICILIVHHTRKQQAEDSFEMISGTTGLLGCADGALLLHKEKRTDHRAILNIVGRDQPDQRLRLLRNEENLTWTLEGADCELWREPPDPLLEQVAQLVMPEQPVWQGSGAEMLEKLGLKTTASSLTRRLNVRAGQLYSTYGIAYKNIRDRAGSHITLTLKNEPV